MVRMTMNAKLWLVLSVMWFGLIVLAIWSAVQTRDMMLAERESGVQGIVQAAAGITDGYVRRVEAGLMTKQDAQRETLATVAAMRFGKDGYLTVFDATPVILMIGNPALKNLLGQSVGNRRDPDGKLFYQDFIKTGNAGGGLVNYVGTLPNGKSAEKTSYVAPVRQWGWYISSGVFLDDVQREFRNNLVKFLSMVVGIGMTVSCVLFLMMRALSRSLGSEPAYALGVASRIAGGDLSGHIEVRRGDTTSLLRMMAHMQGNLAHIVTNVRDCTQSIRQSSQEIAMGNSDLSERTSAQAASLEETAASMEELTSTVRSTADSAQVADELAEQAVAIANGGRSVVEKVMSTMGEIKQESQRVSEIINVIEDIAFQTNILALNASVEAARAGEQGRGFAVVASEVRSLAQRCAVAAKEIRVLIETSHGKVSAGSNAVAGAGETMRGITEAVSRVRALMSEIASATGQQSGGINQVNRAVGEIDHLTQQNAALVEEAAAAAGALEMRAHELQNAVEAFRLA
jgi:methyl-accepting chemotaxis protein